MTKEQAEAARAALNDPAIQDTLSEADQMEFEKLKSNIEVQKLITNSKKAVESISVDGVEVRFMPFLSRNVRRKLQVISKQKTDTLQGQEDIIYNTLATLCLEDPWNKAVTWKFIEANGGDASEYLAQIMGKIKKRTEQLTSFR